jgi:hypothetical protein
MLYLHRQFNIDEYSIYRYTKTSFMINKERKRKNEKCLATKGNVVFKKRYLTKIVIQSFMLLFIRLFFFLNIFGHKKFSI